MSSPTNVLYLGIRVEDREANRAIQDVNRGFEKLAKTGNNAGMQASKGLLSIDEVAKALVSRFGGMVAAGAAVAKAIDFTVGAAQYAAKTQMFGIALEAVGKNAGYTKQELEAATQAVVKLGITRQVAQQSIARMIGAEIDLANATKLARASQDLSRVAAVSGSEALERLTHAVITQQPELFRTLGLNINLQREFRNTARASGRTADSLSEQEKKLITLNAALAGAAKFQGTYEKAVETAGGRTLSLQRRFDNLKDAIGSRLQPALIAAIDGMERWIEVSERAAAGRQGGLFTTGEVAPLFAPGININDLTKAVEQQREANRINQAAVNIAEARAVIGRSLLKNEERLKELRQSMPGNERAGNNLFANSPESLAAPLLRKFGADAETRIEKREAFREKLAERTGKAIKETQKVLEDAQLSELSGLERINAERMIALRQYRLTADEIRQMRDSFKTAGMAAGQEVATLEAQYTQVQREHGAAIANLNRAFDIRERQEREKINRAISDAQRKVFDEAVEQTRELQRIRNNAFLDDLKLEHERLNFVRRTREEAIEATRTNLDLERDYEISKLQLTAQDSLQSRVHVEQETLRIYKRSLDEQAKLATEAARLRADIEISENPRFQKQIESRLEQTKMQLRERTALESRDLEIRSTLRVAEFQREEYRRVWSDVKRSAEGVFDSLTARSRGFADYWKTLFLTGLKEIVTSQIARSYMAMFGGGQMNAPVTRGGGLGALLGLPGFGGAGNIGLPGAPGGTSGFSGPVAGYALGAGGLLGSGGAGAAGAVGATPGFAGGAGGGLGMRAAALSGLASYKTALGRLGNIGIKPAGEMDELRSLLGMPKASAGIGGLTGGAMLLGGSALAAAGLARGGWSGMGMTAAGGALIGMKFGGPMGALIGGAIGAGVGFFRMLFKGAENKAKEKLRAVYGVSVTDRGILSQVVQTAKQTYGGNLDVAVRSPQIRDMIELYAMSTGQSSKFGLNAQTVRPFAASQSGGNIFQQVQYDAGRAFIQQSSLATAGGGKNVFYFDGPALTKIMSGQAVEVIANEPRAVRAANTKAGNGYQRKEGWVQGIAPAMLLR